MFKNLTRALVAALLSAFGPASPAQTAPPLKVAFVYVSPIGEAGWTYQHELGRRAVESAFGARVQTTVVEGVAEGADAGRVMHDLAAQGHGLIFATSFGYLEPALRVAAEFPAVKFEHVGGYKTAPNLKTYDARYYEARYLAGMLAASASRSGTAGYVAGFPVPEVVQGINAFALGMRAVNPKAQVRVLWLNTWFDPAREREAADTLIRQGADVLTHHSGSAAVAQAAQAAFRDRGVRVIPYPSDMRAFAPDAQLAAVTHRWGDYYIAEVRAVLEGGWTPKPVWAGMKEGIVRLEALAADVPKDVAARIEGRRRALADGRFKPFAAPLTDNAGTLRLTRGALDDPAIATMHWFVQGVVGSVPKK